MSAFSLSCLRDPRSFAVAIAATVFMSLVPGFSRAAPDEFSLGQSARHGGAVCDAVSDPENAAVQTRGAHAWKILCHDMGSNSWGYLYYFGDEGEAATATGSAWASDLATRAVCDAMKPANLQGLTNVESASCHLLRGKSAYSVYRAKSGGAVAIAEGFAPISDLVEEGLRVVMGVAPPPAGLVAVPTQCAFSSSAGALGQAASDAEQGASTEYLLSEVHVCNGRWGFEGSARIARLLLDKQKTNPRERARVELALALDLSDERHFGDADAYIANAKGILRELEHPDPLLDVFALNVEAQHLLNQRRLPEAQAAAQAAIADLNKYDPSASEPTANIAKIGESDLISAQVSLELNSGGATLLSGGVTNAQKVQIYAAQDEYVIGSVEAESGHPDQARRQLMEARSRLADSRLSMPWLQADIGSGLSRLDLQERQPSQAIGDATQAVAALVRSPDYESSVHEARAYLARANAEAVAAKSDAALEDYKLSFEMFRVARGVVGDSAALSDGYFRLLIAGAAAEPDKADAWCARFFEAAQSVLSAAAAESINKLAQRIGQSDDALAGLARELQDIQRSIVVKEAQVQQDQDIANAPASSRTALDADQRSLGDLQKDEKELGDKLYGSPYAIFVDATPVTLAQMQSVLRPNEIYVKTVLLPASGYAIAVGKNWARIYALPLSRTLARSAVAELRKPMDDKGQYMRDFDVDASHRLFAAIFGPVQTQVAHAQSLIYEPDGDLVGLPAGLFVVDNASVDAFKAAQAEFQNAKGQSDINIYQGTAWLARNTDVSLSVSARAFLDERTVLNKPSRATRIFAGFGEPDLRHIADPAVFKLAAVSDEDVSSGSCEEFRKKLAVGLSPLNGASDAVLRIGNDLGATPNDMVVNAAFTDEAVERPDLGNYRVLLFATHGLSPQDNDCNSEPALVTSDGLLDETKIIDLHLDADLVVLSACNTGSGSARANKTGLAGSGEELSGLARDFIYAGGRGLIVSHWEVNSSQMLRMMRDFFQSSAETQAGALRRAAVSFMDDPTFAHPYYWAAFSLVGDGEKPMPHR